MNVIGRFLRSPLAGLLIAGVVIPLVLLRAGGIGLEDLMDVGPDLLATSLALNGLRFLAQGMRLHALLNAAGVRQKLTRSVLIRGASEFFALTVFPFGADEAFRTAVLTRLGLSVWTSLRIAFAELIFDVMVVAPFALVAGTIALSAGNAHLAALLIPVASVQLTFSLAISSVVLKGTVPRSRVIGWVSSVTSRFRVGGLNRPVSEEGWTDDRSDLRKPQLVASMTLLSLAVMLAHAVLLQLALSSWGIDLIVAVIAFSSGGVLGSLPVTVGGAGLTEAGIHLALRSLFGVDDLEAVLKWRLMTYHVCLALSALILLLYGRRVRQAPAIGESPSAR
ncbi:MAG: lysylphosphatidylglycerol synthase domain-containing protein [Nitrososphaerota archaeon]|nr:flippase-like domain-containing protein [Candidatus Calditenuis fumarioli]